MDNMCKIKELEEKASKIQAENSHWLSCQDGSYEMALHYAGYWDILKQINQLKEESKNAT